MDTRPWHRSYGPGVDPSPVFEPLSLPATFRRTVERFPDNRALVFMNRTLTWAQLGSEVERAAAGLAGLGVEQGTRVAVQLPNIPQTVISFYAALSLGAEVVMTNPLYTPRELEHQWKDSGCTHAIVSDFGFEQKIRPERDRFGVQHYVIASIPEYMRFPLKQLAPLKLRKQDPPLVAKVAPGAGITSFRDLLSNGRRAPDVVDIDLDAPACLQYTGGTTGPSKGAVLTHRNLSVNVQQIHGWFTGLELGKEVILNCLPLFHVFGLSVGMNWAVYSGAAMILMPNPRDSKALVKNIAKHGVTLFPGVPALFNTLNNYPGISDIDVSSVKYCFSGSAPMAEDVLRRFEELTGAVIVEGFGMSETSPVTHCNPLGGVRKIGTVGIPVAETDSRIVDIDTGKTEMPVGEEGELVIRGPQVMAGYWQRPEETENAIRDGWMHTGDLAVMDEDGYFSIVGRKKDMIIRGGFKIFPDEVDAVLMSHDSILEVATIGVPDGDAGEKVKSFVVLQPGAELDAETLRTWCREELAAYKVPKEVEFLDELPKSSVMKILRRELRERG
ncbi:MAG: long-chain acyl-CoA synthetase [Planctomycetota bacterium]|jgi:long-chain acyl-CoA synthetase